MKSINATPALPCLVITPVIIMFMYVLARDVTITPDIADSKGVPYIKISGSAAQDREDREPLV